MIAEPPNVRLHLANRPENVMLVREVLSGVAEAVELRAPALNDIRTAVTEACNNVVLHAYEGGEGPLEVELYGSPSELEIVVRDYGTGIRPQIRAVREGSGGLGLPVMQALADRVAFQASRERGARRDDCGTEVWMVFATPGTRPLRWPSDGAGECPEAALRPLDDAELAGTMAITITPASLASFVLPRLLSTIAARARFSTDRIAVARLVAEALARDARESLGRGALSLVVTSVARRDLRLQISPLGDSQAARQGIDSTIARLAPVVEELASDQSSADGGRAEVLALRMVDRC